MMMKRKNQRILRKSLRKLNKIITPTEKKNETNLFIFIHSKTMFQIIC